MARRFHLEGRLLAILDQKSNRRSVTVAGILVTATLVAGAAGAVASARAAGPAKVSTYAVQNESIIAQASEDHRNPDAPTAVGDAAAEPADPMSKEVARILAKADEMGALRKQRSRQYLASLPDEQLAKLYASQPQRQPRQGDIGLDTARLDTALKAVRERRGANIDEMSKWGGPLSEQDERDLQLRHAGHVEELAALGPEAVPALALWMGNTYRATGKSSLIKEVLIKMGPKAVEPVMGLMASRDSYLRTNAADVLSRLADPRAKDVLTRALGDADPSVRRCAIQGLLALGPETVGKDELVKRLIGGLQDEPRMFDSIRGLQQYGDETATDTLAVIERFHLGRGKGNFRYMARQAINAILQRAGKPTQEIAREEYDSDRTPTVEEMHAAARCPNAAIRCQAVRGLAETREDQTAIFLIERLGKEEESQVLGEIAYSLSIVMMPGRGSTKSAVSPKVMQEAFDAFLSMAGTGQTFRTTKAIESARSILHPASGSAVPLKGVDQLKRIVREALSSEDAGLKNACYLAITSIASVAPETAASWTAQEKKQLQERLLPLLDQPSPDFRLIECLGCVGDAQLTSRLIRLLDHSDSTIRSFAASALGQIGDPEAIPALKRVAETDPAQHGNGVYGVREAAKRAIQTIQK
ncbi:MAG: HEAT repeat domain-containing protein [Planctomycetota bacterium]|nr:HEAT repeat domain-containing protein [Planctomycetota bacterium]